MNSPDEKPKLLIADDEAANISALVAALRDYAAITIAGNGGEALERGQSVVPDLFLLDIRMPVLDGHEVCRRIRADAKLRNIPVIFITSLDAEEDESLGFELGANDYITKPFSAAIVLARVKTQVELKRHRDHLEELAEARARQLVHSERLATLGTLAAGVAHEINNPLACISAYSELIRGMQSRIALSERSRIEETLGAGNCVLKFLDDCGEYAGAMFEACQRIVRIAESMRTYSKRENENPEPTSIVKCVEKSLQLCAHALKYNITTEVDMPADLPMLMVRPQQIEQVLINLINNAAQAIKETGRDGEIFIAARHADDTVVIDIEDNGPGLPADKLAEIWEPFYTSKGEQGTGLGLAISRGIIEEYKGAITARNKAGGGARFTIILPAGAGPDRHRETAAVSGKNA